MRILFLIGRYSSFGGTEKITTLLANEFSSQGDVVGVASFGAEVLPHRLGLASNVKCYSLFGAPDRKLHSILKNEHIDVVINQWCLPFYVTRIVNKARQGLSVKLVSALHGVPDKSKRVIVAEDSLSRSKGLVRLFLRMKLALIHQVIKASIRYVYRRSDAYVVLSRGFVKLFQDYTALRRTPKLHVIGNPTTFGADSCRVDLSDKKKQILYVGRMDRENKRVNRIVEAWATICCDYPDWNLTLVGGGPHLNELKDFVSRQRIPRVEFTGFVEGEPTAYYRDSSIFMLTSDLEGFGLVILEAMSCGVVPVVYGGYVTVFDIIDSGKDGLITPSPYSHEATVSALRDLIEHPRKREEMAVCAMEKSKLFSIEEVVVQWRRLFEEIHA